MTHLVFVFHVEGGGVSSDGEQIYCQILPIMRNKQIHDHSFMK